MAVRSTLVAIACTAASLLAGAQTAVPSGRIVPTPLHGVTIDDVSRLRDITASLSKLSQRPTARVVFDEFVDPDYYRRPVEEISKVSYVMGELLDSFYMPRYTVDGYSQRVHQYLNALSDVVDIWEIGNEINGEWVGRKEDVVAKMTNAYNIVQSQNKATALTLYYNRGCWESPANEMFRWAEANVPAYMKQGLSYVFVSYYEDDCNGLQPNWQAVFDKLHRMFPNSRIGFGEVGTSRKWKKAEYLKRYYGVKVDVPNYVGGHFWWYFRQDMVPHTRPLWNTLDEALRSAR